MCHSLNAYSEWVLQNYSDLWKNTIKNLSTCNSSGNVSMLYVANYLFQTNKIQWAVDPVYGAGNISTPNDAADYLPELDLILLSHAHPDHFDTQLLGQLCKKKNILIAVPDFMMDVFLSQVDEVNCEVIEVTPGTVINIKGLTATAFNSIHYDEAKNGEEKIGCDELGWLVEIDNHRLLLPVDIRNYNARSQLPDFGQIDYFFSHVWLGRGKALDVNDDFLNTFCQFVADFNAKNVYFGHLHDISRNETECWTYKHAALAMDRLLSLRPETQTLTLRLGQTVNLW